jgi:hypothetical protein
VSESKPNHYVLVTGGRDFDDRASMYETLHFLHMFYGGQLRVIQGGAKGADRLAREVCVELGISYRSYPADWKANGKPAGFIRNAQMVKCLVDWRDNHGHTVQALSFPGGPGTEHCSREAENKGIPVDYIRREAGPDDPTSSGSPSGSQRR